MTSLPSLTFAWVPNVILITLSISSIVPNFCIHICKENPGKHFSDPQVPVRKCEFGSKYSHANDMWLLIYGFSTDTCFKKDIKAEGRINMRLLFQGHLHWVTNPFVLRKCSETLAIVAKENSCGKPTPLFYQVKKPFRN